MSIYISPYAPNDEHSRIDLDEHLFSVHYKSMDGPLGFNIDQNSSELFRIVVENAVWYNLYNSEFYNLTEEFLSNEKMRRINGIFMICNKYVNEEIKKEKRLRSAQKRNQLLQRYGKPPIEEITTIFTDIYDKITRRYIPDKMRVLAKCVEIAIGDEDSLGSYIVMTQGSVFMKRLHDGCSNLKISVKQVQSDKYIPAW